MRGSGLGITPEMRIDDILGVDRACEDIEDPGEPILDAGQTRFHAGEPIMSDQRRGDRQGRCGGARSPRACRLGLRRVVGCGLA